MEIMPEMTEMDEEEMFNVLFKGTVYAHTLSDRMLCCHLYESTHEQYYRRKHNVHYVQRHQKETKTYQEPFFKIKR